MKSMARSVVAVAAVLGLVLGLGSGVPSAAQQGKDKAKASPDQLIFEIYKDKGGKYRFRLNAGDVELAMSPRGYEKEADVKAHIEQIIKGAARAKITNEGAEK